MFIDIVQDMELDRFQKTLMHQMASVFEQHLPDTLGLNHYELADEFGFSPVQWDQFLKIEEVSRLIEREVVQIGEIGARHALAQLQKSNVSTQDIQAAKELLNTSRLLKQRNQKPQVIITRIPAKRELVLDGE